MKITNVKTDNNLLSLSLESDGSGRENFDLQAMIYRELLQQRVTLQAQSRLLTEMVAELRREDLIDVEARFENWQRDYLEQLAATLAKNQARD